MNVPTLPSVIRARWLAIAAAALVASCSTPDNGDGSNQNDSGSTADTTGMDVQNPFDSGIDAPADRPRLRDTGQEAQLDSAFGQCFLTVTPRTGTRSDTFVINGTGVLNATMVALTISADSAPTTFIVNTSVPVSGGAFTFSAAGTMFAPGSYTVNVNDPTFTCSIYGPFTVTM